MKKNKTLWGRYKEWIKKTFPGKKQPKPLQQWDFIMVFECRYKEQMKAYFQRYIACKDPRYNINIVDNQKQQQVLVLIGIPENEVITQAENLKILKRKQKTSYGFDLKTINREIYLAEQIRNVPFCNYLKWIRARLMPQNYKIYRQQQFSVFNKAKLEKYLPNQQRYDLSDTSLFTPEEQLRTKYNFLLTYCIEQKGTTPHNNTQIYPLLDIMRHAGFKQLVPIHKDSKYGRVMLGSMRQYLGANLQSYFDFVSFMHRWLIFPTFIGILTTVCNIVFQFTAEDSPADFLYAFMIMIWSIVFVTQWEHREKWTAVTEQTGYSDEWSEHQNLVDRQGCRNRESRISGQIQQYVPIMQTVWRTCLSFLVCSSVLVATLYFMVLSLNARGFVDENHKFLYFKEISAWAKPGGIFDSSTSWGQIPNLIHVLVTNIFDEQIYRPLTKRFTKYEQHFSNRTYENSIIIKFFIYEFIITFADLFYIAFVRMDIVGLREQLLSLFFIDIIRRFIAELIVPKIGSMYRSWSMKPSTEHSAEWQIRHQAILQVNKDDYQPFDDYLQIVTNFGYLVMISSCFPLAPLLILIAHSIESLQDKYKMVHIFRRKLPSKYVGMGYWNNIVLLLCYISIVTNILLFAFSSHQIASFFPRLYQSGKDIILGNSQIMDLVQDVASSVIDSVVNASALAFDSLPVQQFVQSPFETFCDTTPNVMSFQPPAQEHQIQFVSILFVIEHIFLVLFFCLRNFLSKQKCEADVLIERRQLKRGIKKYFKQTHVITDNLRNSVVHEIVNRNFQAQQDGQEDSQGIGSNLFAKLFQSKVQKKQQEKGDNMVINLLGKLFNSKNEQASQEWISTNSEQSKPLSQADKNSLLLQKQRRKAE